MTESTISRSGRECSRRRWLSLYLDWITYGHTCLCPHCTDVQCSVYLRIAWVVCCPERFLTYMAVQLYNSTYLVGSAAWAGKEDWQFFFSLIWPWNESRPTTYRTQSMRRKIKLRTQQRVFSFWNIKGMELLFGLISLTLFRFVWTVLLIKIFIRSSVWVYKKSKYEWIAWYAWRRVVSGS